MVSLRAATAQDVPALAALYIECALALGPRVYGAAQVQAWASFGQDLAGFEHYVLDADTWLAHDEAGQVLGFCGHSLHEVEQATGTPERILEAEVHSLYVRVGHGRQGLGARLLAHVLGRACTQGARRAAAWATPFSRALFTRAGLPLVEVVQGEFKGMMFERYRMAGALSGTAWASSATHRQR